MRVLLQRVLQAKVEILPASHEGEESKALSSRKYTSGSIGQGLLLFVGFSKEDSDAKIIPMRDKLLGLRVFPNEEGKFDRSLLDIRGGEILIVSQFTLFGDCRKGRRPDFFRAMEPERAEKLYHTFVEAFQHSGIPTQTGEFGADMEVSLVNDGPVTLMLEN